MTSTVGFVVNIVAVFVVVFVADLCGIVAVFILSIVGYVNIIAGFGDNVAVIIVVSIVVFVVVFFVDFVVVFVVNIFVDFVTIRRPV